MGKSRRRFSREFKARVALEALKEQKTMSQLSSEYGVHPNQISMWKKELIEKASQVFDTGSNAVDPSVEEGLKAPLYEEIGRLKIEVDWLKKKHFIFQPGRNAP